MVNKTDFFISFLNSTKSKWLESILKFVYVRPSFRVYYLLFGFWSRREEHPEGASSLVMNILDLTLRIWWGGLRLWTSNSGLTIMKWWNGLQAFQCRFLYKVWLPIHWSNCFCWCYLSFEEGGAPRLLFVGDHRLNLLVSRMEYLLHLATGLHHTSLTDLIVEAPENVHSLRHPGLTKPLNPKSSI